MRLTREQKRIRDGKEGEILQQAMIGLVQYGTAMGAEDFVPISSAHTFLFSPRSVAQYFPPRRVQLTEEDVARFCEKLSRLQVRAKTTINPGYEDFEKWRQMGATEDTHQAAGQAIEVGRRCGILTNWTCAPYLVDNIPLMGEHCSWSESSALIYANSMLGARTNRDGGEASFFSALLGITPNYGLHLEKKRKGTHQIDVQCEISTVSDWGALGYFAGEVAGADIPVFTNLKKPTGEEAKQLGAAINYPGGVAMFHIVGVTPEAPTAAAAFGGKVPKKRYIFDKSAKKRAYERINLHPEGKVDMVYLGCPHASLYEIKEISRLLEGKHVAKGTRLWVTTAHSIRASAERLGYAQVIEDSGAKLFADGCLLTYYVEVDYIRSKRPKLERVASNSVKQALGVRKCFASNVFLGDTERCIQVAIEGGV
jgi:predicted aconitase